MKKKFLTLALSAALMIGINPTSASADSLDSYRQILKSDSYTIRYRNITPAPRVTNRDRLELFGSSGMAVGRNEYLANKTIVGFITSNGINKYEEVGDGAFDMCRLRKGNENFLFTRRTKGDRVQYYGEGRNKIRANSRNYLAELLEGESYGDADMTRLINAIMPDEDKSADMPRYTHVKSGELSDGLSYEDYKSSDGGVLSAIRYYFDGDRLVKIAAADYRKDSDGSIEGRHCIIEIEEFSSKVESEYLTLPTELKDVTKRKKEG